MALERDSEMATLVQTGRSVRETGAAKAGLSEALDFVGVDLAEH